MSKRFLITQIALDTGGRHEVYHWLRIPSYGEAGFYRQSVSFDAFFNGSAEEGSGKQCYCQPGKLFYAQRERRLCDHDIDSNLPVVEHDGLWAFYDFIGYNYRTKKVVAPPQIPKPMAASGLGLSLDPTDSGR